MIGLPERSEHTYCVRSLPLVILLFEIRVQGLQMFAEPTHPAERLPLRSMFPVSSSLCRLLAFSRFEEHMLISDGKFAFYCDESLCCLA